MRDAPSRDQFDSHRSITPPCHHSPLTTHHLDHRPPIARLFGTWTRLRAKLKLPQDRPQSPYTDDELLKPLDLISLRLGRHPANADLNALTPHAATTCRKRCGPAKMLWEVLFKYRVKQALQKRLAETPPASRVVEATRTPAASPSLDVPEPAGAKTNAPVVPVQPAPAPRETPTANRDAVSGSQLSALDSVPPGCGVSAAISQFSTIRVPEILTIIASTAGATPVNAAIKLTEARQQSLSDDIRTAVIEVTDDRGRRFVMISETAYNRLRMFLEAEEIDPSLYEAEEVELSE